MKTFILTTLSVLALSSAAFAQDNVDSEELSKRIAIAKEYSEIVPVESEVDAAIENLILQVPKDDRILFKSILERNVKIPRLQAASEMALAEIFTQDELKALIAFYATPEGQAIREKMPMYQKRLEPVLEQMIREAINSYKSQKQQ